MTIKQMPSFDFSPFINEIDIWRKNNQTLTMWWRDDDAQKETIALHQLLTIAFKHKIPLSLAVIPKGVCPSLMKTINEYTKKIDTPNAKLFHVLQHGYQHKNHAPSDEKKQELGYHRAMESILDELMSGKNTLKKLFCSHFYPVLVPPWNRISDEVMFHLRNANIHYAALSRHGIAKNGIKPFDGSMQEINIHIDILNFKEKVTQFLGCDAIMKQLMDHLTYRRINGFLQEPTGLMTHHLVHDDDSWHFLDELMKVLSSHRDVVKWLSIEEIIRLNA